MRAVLARTSRLSGRVTATGNAPVRGVVAVFPLDVDRRYARSPFVRTTVVDADGRYTVPVPPGQYFVAAVARLPTSGAVPANAVPANMPPQAAAAVGLSPVISEATMVQIEGVSVIVTVGESTEVRQDLRLTSVPSAPFGSILSALAVPKTTEVPVLIVVGGVSGCTLSMAPPA